MTDQTPRALVKLAASYVKTKAVRALLELDERGFWETHAAHLLEQTTLKVSAEQLHEVVAVMVALAATEALIAEERARINHRGNVRRGESPPTPPR